MASPKDLDTVIAEAAAENGVPEALIRAMIRQESSGDKDIVSRKGAQGLMQLMPKTAKGLGVSDPFDIEQNVKAGTRYIKEQIARYGYPLGLAAYNAGPGRVEQYGGVPPFPETLDYLKKVDANFQGLAGSEYQGLVNSLGLTKGAKMEGAAQPAGAPDGTTEMPGGGRIMTSRPRLILNDRQEEIFREWYKMQSDRFDLHPDPDNPQHKYDYRAAFASGANPDDNGHWPSAFKDWDHPARLKWLAGNPYDTKTGKFIDPSQIPVPMETAIAELRHLNEFLAMYKAYQEWEGAPLYEKARRKLVDWYHSLDALVTSPPNHEGTLGAWAGNALRFVNGIAQYSGDAFEHLMTESTKGPKQFWEALEQEGVMMADWWATEGRSLLIAVNPVYLADAMITGDEKKWQVIEDARMRVWESGGLGPIAAMHLAGIKMGVKGGVPSFGEVGLPAQLKGMATKARNVADGFTLLHESALQNGSVAKAVWEVAAGDWKDPGMTLGQRKRAAQYYARAQKVRAEEQAAREMGLDDLVPHKVELDNVDINAIVELKGSYSQGALQKIMGRHMSDLLKSDLDAIGLPPEERIAVDHIHRKAVVRALKRGRVLDSDVLADWEAELPDLVGAAKKAVRPGTAVAEPALTPQKSAELQQKLGNLIAKRQQPVTAVGTSPERVRASIDRQIKETLEALGEDMSPQDIAAVMDMIPEDAPTKPKRTGDRPMPAWLREAMERQGLDPKRSLNDIDLSQPDIIEAIQNDPTLTEAQKAQVLKTGSAEPASPKPPRARASAPGALTIEEIQTEGRLIIDEALELPKDISAERISAAVGRIGNETINATYGQLAQAGVIRLVRTKNGRYQVKKNGQFREIDAPPEDLTPDIFEVQGISPESPTVTPATRIVAEQQRGIVKILSPKQIKALQLQRFNLVKQLTETTTKRKTTPGTVKGKPRTKEVKVQEKVAPEQEATIRKQIAMIDQLLKAHDAMRPEGLPKPGTAPSVSTEGIPVQRLTATPEQRLSELNYAKERLLEMEAEADNFRAAEDAMGLRQEAESQIARIEAENPGVKGPALAPETMAQLDKVKLEVRQLKELIGQGLFSKPVEFVAGKLKRPMGKIGPFNFDLTFRDMEAAGIVTIKRVSKGAKGRASKFRVFPVEKGIDLLGQRTFEQLKQVVMRETGVVRRGGEALPEQVEPPGPTAVTPRLDEAVITYRTNHQRLSRQAISIDAELEAAEATFAEASKMLERDKKLAKRRKGKHDPTIVPKPGGLPDEFVTAGDLGVRIGARQIKPEILERYDNAKKLLEAVAGLKEKIYQEMAIESQRFRRATKGAFDAEQTAMIESGEARLLPDLIDKVRNRGADRFLPNEKEILERSKKRKVASDEYNPDHEPEYVRGEMVEMRLKNKERKDAPPDVVLGIIEDIHPVQANPNVKILSIRTPDGDVVRITSMDKAVRRVLRAEASIAEGEPARTLDYRRHTQLNQIEDMIRERTPEGGFKEGEPIPPELDALVRLREQVSKEISEGKTTPVEQPKISGKEATAAPPPLEIKTGEPTVIRLAPGEKGANLARTRQAVAKAKQGVPLEVGEKVNTREGPGEVIAVSRITDTPSGAHYTVRVNLEDGTKMSFFNSEVRRVAPEAESLSAGRERTRPKPSEPPGQSRLRAGNITADSRIRPGDAYRQRLLAFRELADTLRKGGKSSAYIRAIEDGVRGIGVEDGLALLKDQLNKRGASKKTVTARERDYMEGRTDWGAGVYEARFASGLDPISAMEVIARSARAMERLLDKVFNAPPVPFDVALGRRKFLDHELDALISSRPVEQAAFEASRKISEATPEEAARLMNFEEFDAVRAQREPGYVARWLSTPSNLLSAIPDLHPLLIKVGKDTLPALIPKNPKYGVDAAVGMQTIILTFRDLVVDLHKANTKMRQIFDLVDEADWNYKDKSVSKEAGAAFFDIMNGVPMEKILRNPRLGLGTKKAAMMLREYLDTIKKDIISVRRSQVHNLAMETAKKQYRETHDISGRFNKEQTRQVHALAEDLKREWVPDDWGINDYMPQIHPGGIRIKYEGVQIGTANTKHQAQQKIHEHQLRSKTPLDENKFTFEYRTFNHPDMTRLSRKHYWRLVRDLEKEMQVTPEEVRAGLRGKIGLREFRSKWFGNLMQRRGVEGFSKDIAFVMNRYNWSYYNWKHLSKMSRQVEPILQRVKASGRDQLAEYMQEVFEEAWGKRYGTTRSLDKLVKKMQSSQFLQDGSGQYLFPGLKQMVNRIPPYALDIWSSKTKGLLKNVLLDLNPAFGIRNHMQVFQTLYPILSKEQIADFAGSLRAKGGRLALSVEDRAILERHNIEAFEGGKAGEGASFALGKIPSKQKIRGVRTQIPGFAPEATNQQIAFLTMYKYATKHLKLSDANAANYAFLRGNLFTQFTFLRPDRPKFARGPIGSTVFMFRRFSVKAVELGMNQLFQERRPMSTMRWLAVQALLGGTNSLLRVGGLIEAGHLSANAYKALSEYFDDDKNDDGFSMAKTIHFGLPHFLGADWSYSMQFIDIPLGNSLAETSGKLMFGLPGQMVIDFAKSYTDRKGPVPTRGYERVFNHLTRRIPAFPLRAIEFARQMDERTNDGYYNFKDPAGRVRFKGDLHAALTQMFAMRPEAAAFEDTFTSTLMEIIEKRDEHLDELAHSLMRGDQVALEPMHKWNSMWPEFPIYPTDVFDRMRSRMKTQGLTRSQRMLQHAPAEIGKHPLAAEIILGSQGAKEVNRRGRTFDK